MRLFLKYFLLLKAPTDIYRARGLELIGTTKLISVYQIQYHGNTYIHTDLPNALHRVC